ncbi:hypothetical protein IE81DRAFT_155789 [Ceraceosorus guamensis]|uniref:Palmitoyltransferase n=1 Tax=Ceraceosorus guamensis TaxID=1522189 RepID=A0A316VZH6_9BASI|nr:hypothetical protein IE81DRAFT_155789 [Ceraceosorus guamensis]PWN41833.1 hypothetical protein IE81DRAFT_155789 [Ceraceosorus guamensis]
MDALERCSQREGGSDAKRPRRKWRINNLIGKVVPLILLTYIVAAYKLVVIEHGYKDRYKTRGQVLSVLLHLLPAHLIFLLALRAYLHIYLSHSSSSSSSAHFLTRLLGARRPALPKYPPSDWRNRIFECDAAGRPSRCWRDACNGNWKPPRTRHCGDCGTCRAGLDHHCPWFDADVQIPLTSPSFLHFLILVPLLYLFALFPMFGIAWRHTRLIWIWACDVDNVQSREWWANKWTWMGGPVWRWVGGWIVASRSYTATSAQITSSHSKLVAIPNWTMPLVVTSGAGLVFIALALLFSSLSSLMQGQTTIDMERRKAYSRHVRSVERKRTTSSGDSAGVRGREDDSLAAPHSGAMPDTDEETLRRLSPILYFWVPLALIDEEKSTNDYDADQLDHHIDAQHVSVQEGGIVLPTLLQERPYDLGDAWSNLKLALGMSKASDEDEQWTLDALVEARLKATAARILHKSR